MVIGYHETLNMAGILITDSSQVCETGRDPSLHSG